MPNVDRTTELKIGEDLLALVWPDYLHDCRWLDFEIRLGPITDTTARQAHTINGVLYSLCCFLQHDHRLRGFKLIVHGRSFRQTERRAILNPLHLLGHMARIEYVDPMMPQKWQERVFRAVSPLAGGVLRRKEAVIKEAQAYAVLEREMAPTQSQANDKGADGEEPAALRLGFASVDQATADRMTELVLRAGTCFARLQRLVQNNGFCNAAWETAVDQHATMIEGLLDQLDVEEMEEELEDAPAHLLVKMDEFKQQRLARKG